MDRSQLGLEQQYDIWQTDKPIHLTQILSKKELLSNFLCQMIMYSYKSHVISNYGGYLPPIPSAKVGIHGPTSHNSNAGYDRCRESSLYRWDHKRATWADAWCNVGGYNLSWPNKNRDRRVNKQKIKGYFLLRMLGIRICGGKTRGTNNGCCCKNMWGRSSNYLIRIWSRLNDLGFFSWWAIQRVLLCKDLWVKPNRRGNFFN